MSTAWLPPPRTYHLRVFVICLVIVFLSLAGFLFGVQMEAIVPAAGIIKARAQQDVRAGLAGVVELGWYEATISDSAKAAVPVRLDAQGHGWLGPQPGKPQPIRGFVMPDGRKLAKDALAFHKLQVGDIVWPGQSLARIRADDLELQARRLLGRLRDDEQNGRQVLETRAQLEALQEQLARATVSAPGTKDHWLVLKVHVDGQAAVKAGDAIALIAPVDPITHEPRDLVAHLQIADKHCSELAPEFDVRLYLNMYNQRLHGHADARIERLEPWGEPANGERHFTVIALVTHRPFDLKLGASCKAEIVVGRKPVYRIILEQ